MDENISIVIPIYKVEKYLNRCVESIVNQTYVNLEIILVDDGSPDRCPEMCDEWSKKDGRIKVIHKENGGLSDARNAGMDAATGKYLMLVDSDDYIELDACEKLYGTMIKTNVDFVVGKIREINQSKISYQGRSRIPSGVLFNSSEFIVKSISENEWYAPAVLNLYNVSFLQKNGLRFRKGLLHEDMEFLPRIYLAANSICYLDYAFYNYEIRENSITTTLNNDKKIDNLIYIYNSWKTQFDAVHDKWLQKKLYGALIKHYLHSCRALKVIGWKVEGVGFWFSFLNSLNYKERGKVILFELLPKVFIKL